MEDRNAQREAIADEGWGCGQQKKEKDENEKGQPEVPDLQREVWPLDQTVEI